MKGKENVLPSVRLRSKSLVSWILSLVIAFGNWGSVTAVAFASPISEGPRSAALKCSSERSCLETMKFLTANLSIPEVRNQTLPESIKAVEAFLKANGKLNQDSPLARYLKRLKNYQAVMKNFESCGVDVNANPWAKNLIFAFNLATQKNSDCENKESNEESLKDASQAVILSQMEDKILNETLNDATDFFWNLSKKYDKSLSEGKLVPYVKEVLCPKIGAATCDSETARLVSQRLEDLKKKPIAPVSVSTATKEINARIEQANTSLKDYASKKASGTSAGAEQAYDVYRRNYASIFTTNELSSMLVETGMSTIGEVVPPNSQEKNPASHSPVSEKVFAKSIKRARSIAADQISQLHLMRRNKRFEESAGAGGKTFRPAARSELDLQKLVRTSPVATARVLLQNPDWTQSLCHALKTMPEKFDAKNNENWHSLFMWSGIGLAVAGVALAVTGGWLFAGAGAVALASAPWYVAATPTIFAGLSVAAEGADAALSSYEAGKAHSQLNETYQSLFSTGSMTPEQIQDLQTEVSQTFTALSGAISGMVFTAVDASVILKGVSEVQPQNQKKWLQGVRQTITRLFTNSKSPLVQSVLQGLSDVKTALGNKAAEKLGPFMQRILLASDSLREKFLLKLHNYALKHDQKDLLALIESVNASKVCNF